MLHAFQDWWIAAGGMLLTGAVALGLVTAVLAPRYRLVGGFGAVIMLGAGVTLILVPSSLSGVDREFLWAGSAFFAAALGAGLVLLWPSRTRRTWGPENDIVAARAKDLYESTKYQLSFSASMNASVSVDLKPLGGGLGLTRGVTRGALPQSLPEVVDNFRNFVQSISSESDRTLIVVDELDKMANPEETGEFLNDIKGVFGLQNSIFVLSVSEDALASFERRGLQARDAIDSSFDDVVRIEPLDLAASIDLLDQRVPRVPTPYWALCFALTGGLARDLIRSARSLFDLAAGATIELSAASSAMVLADVRARALGTLAAIGAGKQSVVTPDLATWALALSRVERQTDLRGAVLKVPVTAASSTRPTIGDDHATRLSCQAYLGATIAEVFVDRPFDVFESALGAESPRCLEQIAQARHLLPLSAHAAWLAISDFRVAWQLEPWPSPVQTGPMGVVPDYTAASADEGQPDGTIPLRQP